MDTETKTHSEKDILVLPNYLYNENICKSFAASLRSLSESNIESASILLPVSTLVEAHIKVNIQKTHTLYTNV
jgi:hypothetical protein